MRPLPYAGTPVVPVSARLGTGLGGLRDSLDRVAASLAPRPSREGPTRMHVDRCFTLRGIGTVVTGTLWAGAVTEGQEVRIEPGGRRARVRSVQVHDERVASAPAGRRVALNLAGVERSEVQRGDVVLSPDADLTPAYFVDAEARLLPGARPLRAGTRVHVHHGTRDTPARVVPLESGRLEPGREQLVQLRLERPLVAAPGDRFVMRQVAPPDTLGGGAILDTQARKHGPGAPHVGRLRAMQSGDPLEALRLELEAAQSGVGPEAGPALLAQLARSGAAVRAGRARPRWFAPHDLERARRDVLRAVAASEPGRGVGAGALAHMTTLEVAGGRGGARRPRSRRVLSPNTTACSRPPLRHARSTTRWRAGSPSWCRRTARHHARRTRSRTLRESIARPRCGHSTGW